MHLSMVAILVCESHRRVGSSSQMPNFFPNFNLKAPLTISRFSVIDYSVDLLFMADIFESRSDGQQNNISVQTGSNVMITHCIRGSRVYSIHYALTIFESLPMKSSPCGINLGSSPQITEYFQMNCCRDKKQCVPKLMFPFIQDISYRAISKCLLQYISFSVGPITHTVSLYIQMYFMLNCRLFLGSLSLSFEKARDCAGR